MTIDKLNKIKKRLAKDGNMLRVYRYFRFLPDTLYLSLMFRFRMGSKLDLENPTTFNQKLQYLKLHDRKPVYTQMVDKLSVNEFVKSRCGNELGLIRIIGVYKSFEEIDFNALPDKFVLKCNHDSGSALVCKNKDTFNRKDAKSSLEFALKHNYFYAMREWPYKNVEPKIIAQEYVESIDGGLSDYKIFTFNGKPEIIYIRSAVNGVFYGDYFDKTGRHLDVVVDYPNAPIEPEMPENLDIMLKNAELLSEGTSHLRVDFYEIKGRVYFGELTFYHDGGFASFNPASWDEWFGNFINLK